MELHFFLNAPRNFINKISAHSNISCGISWFLDTFCFRYAIELQTHLQTNMKIMQKRGTRTTPPNFDGFVFTTTRACLVGGFFRSAKFIHPYDENKQRFLCLFCIIYLNFLSLLLFPIYRLCIQMSNVTYSLPKFDHTISTT